MKEKKSKKTIVTIMVFGSLLLAACSPRHSFHSHSSSKFYSSEKRVKWLKAEIADRLELNQEQKTKLDEISQELIESGNQMHAIRASIRDTVLTELRNDEIDKESLIQVFSENRARIDDIISDFADGLVEFHQMLQPNQRAKLVAEIEKHQKRWEKHHRQ